MMSATCPSSLFGIVLLGLSLLPRLAPYFVRGGLYMGSTFLLYVSDASWMKAVAPIPTDLPHLVWRDGCDGLA